MKYPLELVIGLLSAVGILTAAVSLSNGWTWGTVVGLLIWCALMPLSTIAYFGRLLLAIIHEMRNSSRYRDGVVPQVAIDLANRCGIVPPKGAKRMPYPVLSAKVNDNFLFITETMRLALWTEMAKGVMAHEMAHLARKHGKKRSIAYWGVVVVVFLFTGVLLVGFPSEVIFLVMFSIGVTIWPVVRTRVRHHHEYDADSQAAKIVGVETMTHSLRTIVDRPLWNVDSDTHPSFEKRLAKVRKKSNKTFK